MRLPAPKTVGKALRRTAIWLLPRTWPLPPLLRLLPERDRRLIVDMWTIRRARLFDEAWYRRRYPDVAAAGTDALEHYCRQGWRRGRDPGPHFSTTLYLVEHPEAGQAGNPLVYFAQNPTTGQAKASAATAETEVVPASAWYDAATPQLAVVILNFNRAALTLACVASLLRHTEGLRFEIVVVDNGSEPEDFALLARSRLSFRLLRLRHNVYFGEGNNLGVEAAAAPLICLMNNDVIVTAGWLGPMLRLLHGRPDCAAVGPKFLYPDGRIQEAGALVDATGDARRMGHGAAADDPRFGEAREVDYVSAAAVLLSKADFERAGGFDPCWDPAYYEDTDLCLKLAVLGRKTWYCPDAAVIHHESVTTTDPRAALNIDVLKQVNRGIFVERWGRWLAERKAAGSGTAAPPLPLPTSFGPSAGARPAATSQPRSRLALLSFEPLLLGGAPAACWPSPKRSAPATSPAS
ncbi:MAG: glycosyltransferase family 2 protein [Rhodospirillales bacterium]